MGVRSAAAVAQPRGASTLNASQKRCSEMAATKRVSTSFLPEGQSLSASSEAAVLPSQAVSGGPSKPSADAAAGQALSAAPIPASAVTTQTGTAALTPAATPSQTGQTATVAASQASVESTQASTGAPVTPAVQAGVISTYIVFLDDIPGGDPANTGRRVDAVLRSLGASGKPSEVYSYLNGFAIRLTETDANRLRSLGGVKSVEADSQVRLVDPVSQSSPGQDPITGVGLARYTDLQTGSYETTPWGVQAIWNGQYNATSAANLGSGKYAFVIDTGVSSITGDLNVATQYGYSWISNSSNAEDDNGHGTHVAGTIGALVNNYAVVGVAPGTTIVPLKVLDSTGSGSLANAVSAVNYAVQLISTAGSGMTSANAVANLSLGAKSTYKSLDTAIYNASKVGLRFAIAAGNNGSDVDSFTPGRTGSDPNVYTVSAVDNNYAMASWSNWDKLTSTDKIDNVDYATPGVNVLSLSNNYGYAATMSGTSMASPHMAGLLLISDASHPIVRTDMATPYFAGTADPIAHL